MGSSQQPPQPGRRSAGTTGSLRSDELAPGGPFPRFVIVHTPDLAQLGRTVRPEAGAVVFGRDVGGANLAIADRSMSRLHARCTWDKRLRGVRVTDAGSRNGTFVNAQRVETLLLQHGDALRLGDTILVYQEECPMTEMLASLEASAQTEQPVLIQGETGAGKEWLAQRMHRLDKRGGRFVRMACSALHFATLAEEIFGHVEIAHGGSVTTHLGLVRSADRGTLFLDEVADAPAEVQAALLHVIDTQSVQPVGSDQAVPVAARVIAATRYDLARSVVAGTFRPDLFGRLAHVLALPPLRERRDELLDIAHDIARAEGHTLRISTDAAEVLLTWSFPCNVRELRTLIRAYIATRGTRSELDFAYLSERHGDLVAPVLQRRRSPTSQSAAPTRPLTPSLAEPTQDRKRLWALLEAHEGNVAEVAKALGKPRAQVYRWMEALGLRADSFRR